MIKSKVTIFIGLLILSFSLANCGKNFKKNEILANEDSQGAVKGAPKNIAAPVKAPTSVREAFERAEQHMALTGEEKIDEVIYIDSVLNDQTATFLPVEFAIIDEFGNYDWFAGNLRRGNVSQRDHSNFSYQRSETSKGQQFETKSVRPSLTVTSIGEFVQLLHYRASGEDQYYLMQLGKESASSELGRIIAVNNEGVTNTAALHKVTKNEIVNHIFSFYFNDMIKNGIQSKPNVAETRNRFFNYVYGIYNSLPTVTAPTPSAPSDPLDAFGRTGQPVNDATIVRHHDFDADDNSSATHTWGHRVDDELDDIWTDGTATDSWIDWWQ